MGQDAGATKPPPKKARSGLRYHARAGVSQVVGVSDVTAVGGELLTTGAVAKFSGVSPRTAAKWFDSGRLKGWRLPGCQDRRVTPAALVEFMETARMNVPDELRALAFGRPELILYRCPAAVADSLAEIAGVGHVRRVESAWLLAQLFARPHKAGVIVCGDEAARSEIEDVFAHLPARWFRVHARGPDQEPAAGADVALPGDDAAGLLAAVANHLLGAM